MIMINGNWEQVKDLFDIIRIISEDIGYEFAQKVEEISKENEEKLVSEILDLENVVDDLEEKVENCNDIIKQIENYIKVAKKKYEKITR